MAGTAAAALDVDWDAVLDATSSEGEPPEPSSHAGDAWPPRTRSSCRADVGSNAQALNFVALHPLTHVDAVKRGPGRPRGSACERQVLKAMLAKAEMPREARSRLDVLEAARAAKARRRESATRTAEERPSCPAGPALGAGERRALDILLFDSHVGSRAAAASSTGASQHFVGKLAPVAALRLLRNYERLFRELVLDIQDDVRDGHCDAVLFAHMRSYDETPEKVAVTEVRVKGPSSSHVDGVPPGEDISAEREAKTSEAHGWFP